LGFLLKFLGFFETLEKTFKLLRKPLRKKDFLKGFEDSLKLLRKPGRF